MKNENGIATDSFYRDSQFAAVVGEHAIISMRCSRSEAKLPSLVRQRAAAAMCTMAAGTAMRTDASAIHFSDFQAY